MKIFFDIIDKLRIRSYIRKSNELRECGIIAEELRDALPPEFREMFLVYKNEELVGYRSTQILWIVVDAIKELFSALRYDRKRERRGTAEDPIEITSSDEDPVIEELYSLRDQNMALMKKNTILEEETRTTYL